VTQNKSSRYPHKKKRRNSRWMPILIAAGGLLLIGLAVLSFREEGKPQSAEEGGGTPILKVDQETVDLGDVKLDQLVQVSFQLTNAGDQTLRFSEAPYIVVAEGC
jgi:hypothetical protein